MTSKKEPRKQKQDFAPHIDPKKAFPCHIEGCAEPGVYKAPKSKDITGNAQAGDYNWLCLEHIREYNKQWDYFSGMNSEEIEAFMRDAVTGHRPTWSRESRLRGQYSALQDKLYEFISGEKPPAPQPRIPQKIRNALNVMELQHPYTLKQLKIRYRMLVKKYHPDMNKGDKELEEKFKQITSAYKHLLAEIETD
jgi:curved DNA-binding protein CbpA